MKTLARYAWTMAALGGLIFLAGCTTPKTARAVWSVESQQVGPVNDFVVVESSTDRELSPREMTELRQAVANFLESEGLMGRKGEYLVRVDFPAPKPDEPDEWVVVKLTNIPASNFTLIAAYPAIGADDYYPSDYFYGVGYSLGGAPYGYYDPGFFYPGDYRRFGPVIPRRPDNHPRGGFQPGDRDNHPDGTRARDDNRRDRKDGGNDSRPRTTGYTPRPPDADTPRDRGPRINSPRPPDSGGSRDRGPRDYAPPSTGGNFHGSSYTPPPAPPPPPRSDPAPSNARMERADNTPRAKEQEH